MNNDRSRLARLLARPVTTQSATVSTAAPAEGYVSCFSKELPTISIFMQLNSGNLSHITYVNCSGFQNIV